MTTKTPVRCYFDKKSSFLRRNSEKKSRSRRLKKLPEQDGNDLIIVPGKNAKNEYETCNLFVAANMLVVGSSGSGKSNFLYAVITSLVFNRSPENLKLLLIATTKPNLRRFADCRILLPNLSSKSQIFKTYSVSLCFA